MFLWVVIFESGLHCSVHCLARGHTVLSIHSIVSSVWLLPLTKGSGNVFIFVCQSLCKFCLSITKSYKQILMKFGTVISIIWNLKSANEFFWCQNMMKYLAFPNFSLRNALILPTDYYRLQ